MGFLKNALLVVCVVAFWSCEDQIFPDLNTNDPIIVVDAWVNNMPETQVISISTTQDYFDNSIPVGVANAEVRVRDENGRVYEFTPTSRTGEYTWEPTPETPAMGEIGLDYFLEVNVGNLSITSATSLNRVPPIDSITFYFAEGDAFFPDAYFAEVWARDFEGSGDCYWLRTWKNGELLNKPSEISVIYDAGFSAGAEVDGLIFIRPIRESVNPFDEDENEEFLPPYAPGDSIYVELNSISIEAFNFLLNVAEQTNRTGGFAELFAVPLSNVGTNLTATENDQPAKVLGFFNLAAVSSKGEFLDPNNLPGPRN